MSELKVIDANKTNDAASIISFQEPYTVAVTVEGASDLLFHRWNCEVVQEKSKAAKNSRGKKEDNVESYVWRNDEGELCIPGEYLRMSLVNAAKYRQDPRSSRKSAMDLFKAGVVCLTERASLGKAEWDYLDTRRVMVQRSGINRTRPAMKAGWRASFEFQVISPEYIDSFLLADVFGIAGRLIGIGDFRPTYGRFNVVKFEKLSFGAG